MRKGVVEKEYACSAWWIAISNSPDVMHTESGDTDYYCMVTLVVYEADNCGDAQKSYATDMTAILFATL